MARTSVTITTEIDLDVQKGAEWFSALDDEQQAQFFIEVAALAKAWPIYQGLQWHSVGRHLRNCECSTPEARTMIEDIASGIEPDEIRLQSRGASIG